MNDNSVVIEYKWPWTMIPFELVSEWIEMIKKGTSKAEPIYGKKIFPAARHEEKKLILVENDSDNTYAIISADRDRMGELKFRVIESLATRTELANRLNEYHVEAMSRVQYDD